MTVRAIRSASLTFRDDPFKVPAAEAVDYRPDALITIEDGHILAVEDAAAALPRLGPDIEVTHYPDSIACPGFIDAHVHYPQMQMIGAFGEQLLEWLDRYTFVAEQDFADPAHAKDIAARFLRELLRAGTTTASVYCTVHPQSVEAFFGESDRFNTRMIAGKVLMDRNAPEALRDTVESGIRDSQALIDRWHGKGRQLYSVTPRFAPSSTDAQLEAAGKLWRDNPGTYVQSHLSESMGEVAWVRELFPERSSYLDVYDHAGLTGPRAVFGHAVHLDEADFDCCHRTGSALAHCPTSNLFLGSGLFRMLDAKKIGRPVRVGLGTDLGAGTSFSQLQTLNEAYKVAKLGGGTLTPEQGFYLATRGGAEALYLDDKIGSIAPGYEADLVILDKKATPLLDFRMRYCQTLAETLFVLMTLGDDRAIRATYVAGAPVYDRDRAGDPFSPRRAG